MDLDWFKDLGHLAKTTNFTQAATLSNISQPTLSRRIRALESWAGVELVDRKHYPVKLTVAGQQILEAAEQATSRLETERQQLIDAYTLPDQYVVTFGTQHSLGWRFFPNWLQSLEDTYAPILSRLRADNLPDCVHDLADGQLDFVIAYQSLNNYETELIASLGLSNNARFESLLIGSDALVPVCKPLADGRPMFDLQTSINELPFLDYGQDAYLSTLLTPMINRYALDGRLQIVYQNTMAGALRIRARDGHGLAWLPKSLVEMDLKSGALCQLNNSSWVIEMEIRLFRNRENVNRCTDAIWTFLEHQAAFKKPTLPTQVKKNKRW